MQFNKLKYNILDMYLIYGNNEIMACLCVCQHIEQYSPPGWATEITYRSMGWARARPPVHRKLSPSNTVNVKSCCEFGRQRGSKIRKIINLCKFISTFLGNFVLLIDDFTVSGFQFTDEFCCYKKLLAT